MKPLLMYAVTFIVTLITFIAIGIVIVFSFGYHWGTPEFGRGFLLTIFLSMLMSLMLAALFSSFADHDD